MEVSCLSLLGGKAMFRGVRLQFKHFVSMLSALFFVGLILTSCSAADKGRVENPLAKKPADPTVPTPTPTPSTANYTIEISTVAPTTLVSKDTADVSDATCTNEFTVTVKDSGTAVADAPVTLAVVSATTGVDVGSVSPASSKTDASGQVKGKYCAGDTAVLVTVTAAVFNKQANTGTITTTKKSKYAFSYEGTEELADNVGFVGSLVDRALGLMADAPAPDAGNATEQVLLNLYGSGKDRINLVFKAIADGAAYAGATATFVSQPDYPMGAKLGLCSAAAATGTDSVTGRIYLQHTATSNAAGLFKVPVCAARMPGLLMVKGSVTLGTGTAAKIYKAEAPAVLFEGGLANYGHMSITYDTTNAKVLKSSFLTNTEGKLKFKARLQSRLDGALSDGNPLGIFTEYGRVTAENGGKPKEDGSVAFEIEALNGFGQRPLRVTSYDISNGDNYDHMCTPSQFTTTTPFSTLARDWRSTVLYYIKGQEQFFDANYNGQYDIANSVGFWDRNQNGLFDCTYKPLVGTDTRICDVITYVNQDGADATLKSITVGSLPMGAPTALCTALTAPAICIDTSAKQQAIYKYDWFIDMPTPFVDSDENGDHRVGGVDQLAEYVMGESFQLPNGKWDREGYVWKSFVMPIFAGASPYSLTHRVISSDLSLTFTATDADHTATGSSAGLASFFQASGYATSLYNAGATADDTGKRGVRSTLFGCNPGTDTPTRCLDAALSFVSAGGWAPRYFFAQGTCGAPLPGGSKIVANVTTTYPADVVGARAPLIHFYMQPNDDTLEPHRRLLRKSDGTSEAEINFDPTQHPSKDFGYPVQFFAEMFACTNSCTGDLQAGANLYCDAQGGRVDLTASYDLGPNFSHSETIHESWSVAQVNSCVPATGAVCIRGTCTCPSGQNNENGICVNM
jgi:hypothetical protein